MSGRELMHCQPVSQSARLGYLKQQLINHCAAVAQTQLEFKAMSQGKTPH